MAVCIDPIVMQQIIVAWQDAPHGHKRSVVEKHAAMIGCDPATIYRGLPINRKTRSDAGERKIEGLEEAARTIAAIKNSPPEHRGVISTCDAARIALINGKIAAELAAVPFGTWDRVIRELGLQTQRRRIERFQADMPNEMHHVDASTSNCFYIAKALPDGDFLLRLHRGNKDYKNKPIPVDGLRPWIYGMTDDHSGCHCCRYVAAKGENSRHNMEFLAWAWWENPEKCFWGVPAKIKGDHGPMMESPEAKDFFARLGVEIDPSEPLNKDAHGKIERPWRTLWQSFELPFFAMSEWRKYEITLSELNSQLFAYSAEYNEKKHRFERKYKRREMWERISRHGGVVILPNDALETIAKSNITRVVDQAGVFWMDNVPYEVIGLHDAEVKVIVGVFDKQLVVEDLADGRKYEVESFRPNALGEFRANPDTGQQQMRKAAAELDGINTPIYSKEGLEKIKSINPSPALPLTREGAKQGKVVKMPTRVKEIRQLENPLDVDRFADVGTAIRELQGLVGFFFLGDERAAVAQLIEENGLSRRFVAELAGEIEQERRVAL